MAQNNFILAQILAKATSRPALENTPFPRYVRYLKSTSQGPGWDLGGEVPTAFGRAFLSDGRMVEVYTPLRSLVDYLARRKDIENGLYQLQGGKILALKELLPENALENQPREMPFTLSLGKRLFCVVPLKNNLGETFGYYVREARVSYLKNFAYALFKRNALPTIFFLGVALVIALMLTRHFVCIPLNNLHTQLTRISQGIGKRLREAVKEKIIEAPGNDEISALARTINQLVKELDELASFRQAIEMDETPLEIYHRLHRVLTSRFGLSNFVIFEISNSQNRITPVVTEPPHLLEECCLRDINQNPKLCRVYRSASRASSLHFTETCEYFRHKELNYICLPLCVGGKVIGIIHFLLPMEYALKEMQQAIMDKVLAYIKEAAPIIEAKRFAESLREMSFRDSLTGLYNRRILDDLIPQVAAGIVRRESNLGIIMFDIDHFKILNDTYGHSFGDKVLAKIGDIIRFQLRKSDFAIRFGGEEFLLLLVDAKPGSTLQVAERLRQHIETSAFVFEGKMATVTISAGVAEFPRDDTNLWNVINFADVALYRAKAMGRNRVVRFEKSFLKEELKQTDEKKS
ncbi:MAG: GGDEF domain-containing protein [Thermodesulfobacteria bacterium]|nr:GGDEF domain-containing protein [Thermodesulfobacteriota bacterium]